MIHVVFFFVKVLYLLGAMSLSMALQLDRHGLWNLLGPSLFALGIMAVAWVRATVIFIAVDQCFTVQWKMGLYHLSLHLKTIVSEIRNYDSQFMEINDNDFSFFICYFCFFPPQEMLLLNM